MKFRDTVSTIRSPRGPTQPPPRSCGRRCRRAPASAGRHLPGCLPRRLVGTQGNLAARNAAHARHSQRYALASEAHRPGVASVTSSPHQRLFARMTSTGQLRDLVIEQLLDVHQAQRHQGPNHFHLGVHIEPGDSSRLMMSTSPRRRDFLRFLTDRRTLRISAPFSCGLMSATSPPQGLEPFQFSLVGSGLDQERVSMNLVPVEGVREEPTSEPTWTSSRGGSRKTCVVGTRMRSSSRGQGGGPGYTAAATADSGRDTATVESVQPFSCPPTGARPGNACRMASRSRRIVSSRAAASVRARRSRCSGDH